MKQTNTILKEKKGRSIFKNLRIVNIFYNGHLNPDFFECELNNLSVEFCYESSTLYVSISGLLLFDIPLDLLISRRFSYDENDLINGLTLKFGVI